MKQVIRNRSVITAFAVLSLIVLVEISASAQTSLPAPSGLTATQDASLHGVVLNANTDQPIARALVQAGGKSLLTAHDGKFAFGDLTGNAVMVKVTKPGFYEGLDPNQAATRFTQPGSPDELLIRLYPEALITGTLTAPNGDPLAQVNVQALRLVYEDEPRWIMGGQTFTNADGQFRLPLPGGDYVVMTQYSQGRSGGAQAVLPLLFPPIGASGGSNAMTSTIRVPGGTEQHLELHPPVRSNHAVTIQIDHAGGPLAIQGNPQIQAHLANGLVFSPSTHRAEKEGEVVVNLPSGTYLLGANAGGRDDGSSYGETKVTVTDADISGVVIHMQQATELTLEASVDPAAATASQTVVDGSVDRQLGLFMVKTDSGIAQGNSSVSPASRRNAALSFSLLPGKYRLRSTAYSPWYVESASVGGTDLLTQDLVVDGGSSALSLRVVVNNDVATVKGTVSSVSATSASYVYFIADAPSTTPVISVRTSQDGSFSRAMLRPGSYRVLASENRAFFNLAEPAVLAHFASYIKTITVGAGETGTVDLSAVPASEWK